VRRQRAKEIDESSAGSAARDGRLEGGREGDNFGEGPRLEPAEREILRQRLDTRDVRQPGAEREEREEVEAYIDGRLATLEVILTKTMEAVARGRERLEGADDKDVLSQLNSDN
jgi:hypothetical protein